MLETVEQSQSGVRREAASFELLAGDLTKGCLIVCDHASNWLPPAYGSLGLGPDQLERHIAYDIGVAGVTKNLSRLMGVPAVLACFSRLLIDPNRGFDDPTLIMQLSDGAIVPGNANIDAAEIERRKALYYQPYHDAIDATIDQAMAAGRPPIVVSIHSFTDNWKGRNRPWQVTVLWDRDPRLPRPLLEALGQEPDIVVGENVPYSGELKGDCLYRHGTQRGLAHALIELRQDLIKESSGQQEWAERLARVLTQLLGQPNLAADLHQIQHHGSNTDPIQAGDEPGSN
jgi:predicted N-formylglutamate amidohydrolase